MRNLIELLTGPETEAIDTFWDAAERRHPAWTALHADDVYVKYDRSPKDHLVNASVSLISSQDGGPNWLKSVTKRVAQINDFEEAASALAEIRCYGAMLEAGFGIHPIPTGSKPTADFEFRLVEQNGVVEVAAKLEHADQVLQAISVAAGDTLEGVDRATTETSVGKVATTTREMHPFGAPDPKKAGDTTQTNAISRICSVKGRETQATPGTSAILWIDFRDLGKWPGILTVEQSSPLVSSGRDGLLTSGAIWYGFYGWKGAPVLEGSGYYHNFTTPMAHFGRFHPEAPKKSLYSGAVICLKDATLLFENTAALQPLSRDVRLALTRLPFFDIAHSIVDWKEGDVQRNIDLARSMIEDLSTAHSTGG